MTLNFDLLILKVARIMYMGCANFLPILCGEQKQPIQTADTHFWNLSGDKTVQPGVVESLRQQLSDVRLVRVSNRCEKLGKLLPLINVRRFHDPFNSFDHHATTLVRCYFVLNNNLTLTVTINIGLQYNFKLTL